MSGNWKITIVGGSLNGMDFSFSPDAEVLIGRSSKADVRMSNAESDISGHHLKLVVSDGVPTAVNVTSRARATFHQGVEMAPNGGEVRVAAHDAIELGASRGVRIRFDEVPSAEIAPVDEDDDPSDTSATRWNESTFCGDAPTAEIEELGAVPPRVDGEATFATRESETFSTRVPESTSGSASFSDGETVLMPSDVGATFAGGDRDSTMCDPDDDDESGKTQELHTMVADQNLLEEERKKIDRRRKRKYGLVVFVFMVVAVALAGLWLWSQRETREVHMEWPSGPDGRPDAARYAIKDEQGRKVIEVDYPRDDGMSVTESPDGNGVSVVSVMGRRRDVPFFLHLEVVRRDEELETDLLSSVRSWMSRAEESDPGYVFDTRVKDELRYRFFEDVFPGSCERGGSLYGVKFVMFDYKRTWSDGDNTMWHGVLIYFRKGDTAFVHRREIPEFYWVRGGYRIEQDPNIALHSNFIDSYWESPGLDGLPMGRNTSDLIDSVRGILSKERASDWRYAKKEIDAILVKSWRTDPKSRGIAEGCLRQFREVLRTYYYGKYNAFIVKKENHDERGMARLRRDAAMVFDDPEERYYHLVGNGEVW